ncbi:1363_t:CDS:1, partial [Acaulospora colombiana]
TGKRVDFYSEQEGITKKYKRFNWIVFFSPSGVDVALGDLKKLEYWDEVKIAAIGKTTGSYLEETKGIKVHVVSPKPDPESLVNSIDEYDDVTISRSGIE